MSNYDSNGNWIDPSTNKQAVLKAVKAPAVRKQSAVEQEAWNATPVGQADAAASGKMVAYVLFKMEGVDFDPITGSFSMAVEQKILDEQDWQNIAGSFGLNTVPDHLRDDLCKMVRQHAIVEQLADRITDVQ